MTNDEAANLPVTAGPALAELLLQALVEPATVAAARAALFDASDSLKVLQMQRAVEGISKRAPDTLTLAASLLAQVLEVAPVAERGAVAVLVPLLAMEMLADDGSKVVVQ